MEDKILYDYLQEVNALLVSVIGRFPVTNNEIDQHFKTVSELFIKYNTNKLILDYRKMIYDQSVLQIVKGPERIIRYNMNDRVYYCAVLFDTQSETYMNYKLFLAEIDTKIFFGKIKGRYQIFNEFDSAVEWIKLKAATESSPVS
ncbi:MAG: hypothetical protein JW904_13465 [Spirochaetales bacterium]|nr:hypothetical protein [Spirochaetales bacterium]